MLLFIHKNSPAGLGRESAPRGGQGSRSRAADPGGPGRLRAGAQPAPSSQPGPAQNRIPSWKFQGAGRIGVSALKGMVFVCGVSSWIQVWEGDE